MPDSGRFLFRAEKNSTMHRLFMLLAALFILTACPAVAALSITTDPAFNGTFANAATKMSVKLDNVSEASALWYKADSGTENALNIVGGGYPEMPLTAFFSGLNECTSHTLAFYANDSNASIAETDIYFTYDSAPPSAPAVVQPTNGSVVRSTNVMLSWNASVDTCSDVRGYYDVSITGCTSYSVATNETSLAMEIPDGDCMLSVTAYDSIEPLSIANRAQSSSSFRVDTSGPVITLLSPLSKAYSRTVWFNASLDRNGTCILDNGTTSVNMGMTNEIFNVLAYVAEGQNNATLSCTDEYNHTSTKTVIFAVDVSPPLKTLVSVGGDTDVPYNVSRPSTEINLTLSEVGSCRVSPDNRSYSAMTNYSQCSPQNSTSVSCREMLQDGQHTRYVACTDGFNEDTVALNISFNVNILYSIAISVDSSGYVRAAGSREYSLSLRNDGFGNITNMNITLSRGEMNASWISLSATNTTLLRVGEEKTVIIKIDPPSTAGNSTYSLVFYVNATQLNVNSVFTVEVRARETPEIVSSGTKEIASFVAPAVTGVYPDDGFVNARAVTVSVRTDRKATCRLDEEDGSYNQLGRGMITADGLNHTYRFSGLAPGSHEYVVRCKSDGGAAMDSSIPIKFSVDLAGPVTAMTNLGNQQNTTEFSVSWDGKDELSGMDSYTIQFKKDEGPWETWLEGTAEKSAMFKAENGYMYRFRSLGMDKAGNVEVKVATQDDTYTTVAAAVEIKGMNATGIGTGMFAAGTIKLEEMATALTGFLNANGLPIGLTALVVIAAAVLAKSKPEPSVGGKTLRKQVMDEWRGIKSSLNKQRQC